jgi:16S rRNA (guanine527-N7)-methyltransferase
MDYDRNQGIIEFRKGLDELEIKLDNNQINQFIDYYEMLVEKNKVMNLTSITEYMDVIKKHFLDSLTIVNLYRPVNDKILDLGTGAGFPGIPLKIAFPNTTLVLMDSLKKRILFLDEVIEKLKLDNITTIHGRAEDYGRDPLYRETFDICTSRAVAKLSVLAEYCIPFIRKGGRFISYKSGMITDELMEAENAIKILGGRKISSKEFYLPHSDISRSLILIEKANKTPNKYPRAAGKVSKEPI